jgi:hypothetical protein
MSRYSMLTIPPLKNLQQGYCSVTATEGPRKQPTLNDRH